MNGIQRLRFVGAVLYIAREYRRRRNSLIVFRRTFKSSGMCNATDFKGVKIIRYAKNLCIDKHSLCGRDFEQIISNFALQFNLMSSFICLESISMHYT